MHITMEEIGKKISTANEQRIRAAMASLQGIMSLLMHADSGDEEGKPKPPEGGDKKPEAKSALGTIAARLVPATEAASPRGPIPTLDAVRASLQKLIDTLPAQAKEDLEGDGDGDGDTDNAQLQTHVGAAVSEAILTYLDKVLSDPDLKESPGPPMNSHGSAGHADSFPDMGGSAQQSHLTSQHNVPDNHPSLQVPAKRIAMHSADHAGSSPPAKESFSFETEFVPLVEKAVSRDGTFEVKIIQPGWGSSGYYGKGLLERDGPKVFTKGLKMYWDHPTKDEDAQRPERSLRDLSAELVSDAKYVESHKQGAGLYAHAKALQGFGDRINELAPHIGVSIRADGEGKHGTAEGRSGRIIEAITRARSTDFVTVPGAGGKIISLFEAARPGSEENDVDLTEARRQLDEANTELARLREAVVLREARDIAIDELAKKPELPAVTVKRLTESLSHNPPIKDGKLDTEAFTKAITEAVKSELAYLHDVIGTGRVRGMSSDSGNGSASDKQFTESLEDSFRTLGLSESLAKSAAQGR